MVEAPGDADQYVEMLDLERIFSMSSLVSKLIFGEFFIEDAKRIDGRGA